MGVVPQPINATQCAELTQLLENPPEGEEDFLLDLITNRVPPSIDEAALTKADFLTAIIKGLHLLIFPFSCYFVLAVMSLPALRKETKSTR
jgi:aconitase B